jgi:hypothetical protein
MEYTGVHESDTSTHGYVWLTPVRLSKNETMSSSGCGGTTRTQGWPRSRAKLSPLIGILSQNAGPSRALRANPVGGGECEGVVHVCERILWNFLWNLVCGANAPSSSCLSRRARPRERENPSGEVKHFHAPLSIYYRRSYLENH